MRHFRNASLPVGVIAIVSCSCFGQQIIYDDDLVIPSTIVSSGQNKLYYGEVSVSHSSNLIVNSNGTLELNGGVGGVTLTPGFHAYPGSVVEIYTDRDRNGHRDGEEDKDSDGDGVYDAFEEEAGTNPNAPVDRWIPDINGDGYYDQIVDYLKVHDPSSPLQPEYIESTSGNFQVTPSSYGQWVITMSYYPYYYSGYLLSNFFGVVPDWLRLPNLGLTQYSYFYDEIWYYDAQFFGAVPGESYRLQTKSPGGSWVDASGSVVASAQHISFPGSGQYGYYSQIPQLMRVVHTSGVPDVIGYDSNSNVFGSTVSEIKQSVKFGVTGWEGDNFIKVEIPYDDLGDLAMVAAILHPAALSPTLLNIEVLGVKVGVTANGVINVSLPVAALGLPGDFDVEFAVMQYGPEGGFYVDMDECEPFDTMADVQGVGDVYAATMIPKDGQKTYKVFVPTDEYQDYTSDGYAFRLASSNSRVLISQGQLSSGTTNVVAEGVSSGSSVMSIEAYDPATSNTVEVFMEIAVDVKAEKNEQLSYYSLTLPDGVLIGNPFSSSSGEAQVQAVLDNTWKNQANLSIDATFKGLSEFDYDLNNNNAFDYSYANLSEPGGSVLEYSGEVKEFIENKGPTNGEIVVYVIAQKINYVDFDERDIGGIVAATPDHTIAGRFAWVDVTSSNPLAVAHEVGHIVMPELDSNHHNTREGFLMLGWTRTEEEIDYNKVGCKLTYEDWSRANP